MKKIDRIARDLIENELSTTRDKRPYEVGAMLIRKGIELEHEQLHLAIREAVMLIEEYVYAKDPLGLFTHARNIVGNMSADIAVKMADLEREEEK